MPTPESGVPWTSGGVDDMTAGIDERNDAAEDDASGGGGGADEVIEAANLAALPVTGDVGVIYVTLNDNKTYRWSGSAYVEISASLALGETSATAYRGDRGKTGYDHSQVSAANPHGVTKTHVGLGSVDNTADADKPVSTAQQTALDLKANLANPTGTGEAIWPSLRASGKTGATATPFIVAGGTAAGAPASGAHVKGEMVLDDNGAVWICTVAGTPGTWVQSNSATFAPKASPTFTGVPVAPVYSASGITGAVAGARFVGATTSGAPASGTFLLGDYVVDQLGQMWVCTVAGSPGTWIAPGSGRELGYAEITSNQTGITGVGTANKVAVTGLSVTVTVASRPLKIIARTGNSLNTTADNGGGIAIVDTADTATLLAQASGISPIANGAISMHVEARKAPAAGSKTYAVYAWAVVGGSFTLAAGAQNPAFIQVIEV